ncbi:MAG: TlpA family protein disulfide reductase [Proteobacteria bacterium]|nr:TlpA family protein disulfide reductase [Pseudomonadota bacterium]
MNRFALALVPLLLTSCVRSYDPIVVLTPPVPVQERSGWLMNRAQIHQWDWELAEAQDALAGALRDDPHEGYTHQLIGATLAHGFGLGDETVAVYAYLEEVQPEDPAHAMHGALATLELHRTDRFSGPTAGWFVELMAAMEALATDENVDERTRFEALIARRNLLFLMKDPAAARAEGTAAHELLPDRLQGRITALAQARRDKDLARQVELCAEIIRTDPWAVEACSIAAVGQLEEINPLVAVIAPDAPQDRVIANELHKYYKRTKQDELRTELVAAVRAVQPDFVPVNPSKWYTRSAFTGSQHYDLLRGSNQSLGIENLTDRMAKLDELAALVPDPLEADLGVERWFRARYVTADKMGDAAVKRSALAGLCEVSDDPRWCLELAAAADGVEGLEAAQKALELLDGELQWRPAPRGKARFDFTRWAERQITDVAAARAREAELLPTVPDASAYGGTMLPRWPTSLDDGDAWTALAISEGLSDGLAVHAALHAFAVTGTAPEGWFESVLPRFGRLFPMVTASGVQPAQAFGAAAAARKAALDAGPAPERGAHPFVGKPAPALEVTDLEGNPISLADLQGRVVLVDFWATWCGPCIKEMPELQATLDRLGDEPVTLLALSVDDAVDPVAPFIAQRGFEFDVAWIGTTGPKQEWMVKGIPSLFVIGPDGVVRNHHQGFRSGVGEIVEAEVRALLGQP